MPPYCIVLPPPGIVEQPGRTTAPRLQREWLLENSLWYVTTAQYQTVCTAQRVEVMGALGGGGLVDKWTGWHSKPNPASQHLGPVKYSARCRATGATAGGPERASTRLGCSLVEVCSGPPPEVEVR